MPFPRRSPQPLPLVSLHSLPSIMPISSTSMSELTLLLYLFSLLLVTGDWNGENETHRATFHAQLSALKVFYNAYL